MILQQQYQVIGQFLGFFQPSTAVLNGSSSESFKAFFRLFAALRVSPQNIQLVFKKQPGTVTKFSIHDSTETTGTPILGLLRWVGNVNSNISTFDVHIANANAAAVEVAVFEEVHDGLGEDEVDVQAVCLGDGRHRGRLHRVEGPAGGGRGGGRVQIRVLVLHRALRAGGPAGPARRPRSPGRPGSREARGGRGREDSSPAVAGRGAAGGHPKRSVGLGGVGRAVLLVHGAPIAGDRRKRRKGFKYTAYWV